MSTVADVAQQRTIHLRRNDCDQGMAGRRSTTHPRLMDRTPSRAVALAALLLCLLTGCGQPNDSGVEPIEALPSPAEGSQWVSWRDVAVQVPSTWDFGWEPGDDWCADGVVERLPQDPYVAINPGYGPTLDIGCGEPRVRHDPAFGSAPETYWAPHAALETAVESSDVSLTDGTWFLATRTLGDVRVRLLTEDEQEAEEILATATRFAVDQNGCEPTSPVQASEFVRPVPFDITAVSGVESVSVCQYERGIPMDEPALMGSRTITGAEADALLRGLQSAPVGGGPDKPDQCSEDSNGDTGIALHLDQGSRTDTVFVYSDTCRGNGTDDGTEKRGLTEKTCSPLFEPPVVAWTFSTSLLGRCG